MQSEPLLPVELLREIIQIYVSSLPSRATSAHEPELSLRWHSFQEHKPEWKHIESLSLSSKTMRFLVLEAWFETYVITDPRQPVDPPSQWAHLKIKDWTRRVHFTQRSPSHISKDYFLDLKAFPRLRKVRLDLISPGGLSQLLGDLDVVHEGVHELEMNGHPYPNPGVVRLITETFPDLRVLRMSQNTVWCGLCNICRFAEFLDEPPNITYTKGYGLPAYYGPLLSPLVKLHSVYLNIGYVEDGYTSLNAGNINKWSGECDDCMLLLFPDEEFRESWIERKEQERRPPSLEQVEWRFREIPHMTESGSEPSEEFPAADGEDDIW